VNPATAAPGLETLGVLLLDGALRDLLGFAMLPTADAPTGMRDVDWDYEPAAPALLQLAVMTGAGSAEQRALHSLLCSVVKVCVLQSSNKLPGVLQELGRCILLAVDSTAAAAMHLLKLTPCSPAATPTACSSAAGTAAGSPGSSAQAVQLLPSLVIFGRLCLLYGQQLPAKIPLLVCTTELKTRCPGTPGGMSQQEYTQLIRLYSQEAPRNSVVDVLWREAPGGNGRQSKFDLFLLTCLNWLKSASGAAQLLAAGYGPAAPSSSDSSASRSSRCGSSAQVLPVVEQLQALAVRIDSARSGDTPDPAPFLALAQQLLATGKALSNMAMPACCNNPVCGNISRTLEVSIVSRHAPSAVAARQLATAARCVRQRTGSSTSQCVGPYLRLMQPRLRAVLERVMTDLVVVFGKIFACSVVCWQLDGRAAGKSVHFRGMACLLAYIQPQRFGVPSTAWNHTECGAQLVDMALLCSFTSCDPQSVWNEAVRALTTGKGSADTTIQS
jgi:hypothetical protein